MLYKRVRIDAAAVPVYPKVTDFIYVGGYTFGPEINLNVGVGWEGSNAEGSFGLSATLVQCNRPETYDPDLVRTHEGYQLFEDWVPVPNSDRPTDAIPSLHTDVANMPVAALWWGFEFRTGGVAGLTGIFDFHIFVQDARRG